MEIRNRGQGKEGKGFVQDGDERGGTGAELAELRVQVVDEKKCPFLLANGSQTVLARRGETIQLDGPSGVGKSSIALSWARACWENSSGGVAKSVLGFSVTTINKQTPLRAAMLFQEAPLVDSLTVGENMRLSLRLGKQKDDEKHIREILAKAGLQYTARLERKLPSELSVGMSRRVGLAVTLCQNPDLLFIDEPFASLDASSAKTIALQLRRLQVESGLSIVLVSHLEEFASLLEPSSVIKLTPNPHYHESPSSTLSLWRMVSPNSGLELSSRVWSEFMRLVLLPSLLCFVAGGLVGGGFMSLLNAFIRYIDVDMLLEAVPPSIRKSSMFSLVRGAAKLIDKKGVDRTKAKVIGLGLSYVSCVEIAPLLVGMVMSGVYGSFLAGRIASMQSTDQDNLLYSIGLRKTWRWTMVPSLLVAILGGPLLFLSCYFGILALGTGALTDSSLAPHRDLLWNTATEALWDHNLNGGHRWERGWMTYLPFVAVYRTIGFLVTIVLCSEFVTRCVLPSRTAKDVSQAIAASVMASMVGTLIAEFCFTHLLLATLQLPSSTELLAKFGVKL